MPNINEITEHPDYMGLPTEEKRKVLSSMFEDFRGLPVEEQDKIISYRKEIESALTTPEGQELVPEKAEPTFWEEFKEDIPGAVGGLIGGIAKTIGTRTMLSALLAAGGEGYHQLYQQLSGSPKAPETSLEAVKRMARMGGFEAIGGLFGEGIVLGVSKVLPKVKPQYLIAGLKEPEDALRPYMEQYLPRGRFFQAGKRPAFTISQKAEPFSSASKFETIIEKSFGGGPIARFKFAQKHAVDDMVTDITNTLWHGVERLKPSERGEILVNAFDIADEAFMATAKRLYGEVDDVVGGAIVDLRPVKEIAMGIQERAAKMGKVGSSQTGDALVNKVLNLDDFMSFADSRELRSRLLKEEWALEKKDVAKGVAVKLERSVNKSMEKAAKELSPDAKNLWKQADDFYRTGKEIFNDKFLVKLVEKGREEPALVGKTLFQNAKPNQINKVRELLKDDRVTWRNLKAGFVEDVLEKSTHPETGELMANKLAKIISDFGKESMEAAFSPKERHIIETLVKTVSTVQKPAPQTGGGMLIQLLQGRAIATLGTAITGFGLYKQDPQIMAMGATVLFSPPILARMLVNPKFHSLFLQGMSTSRPIAMPAISKLVAAALEIKSRQTEREF